MARIGWTLRRFRRRFCASLAMLLGLTLAAQAQECRLFKVAAPSLNVSAEAREDAAFVDVIDKDQVVCVTREQKVGKQDWAYVAHIVKGGSERQPIDGWVPVSDLAAVPPAPPKNAATSPPASQPASPALKPAAPAAAKDTLSFREPIPFGPYPVNGQSIEALAKGKPQFPPFEGLDEEIWKQPCTACHVWEQKSLCEQGGRYAADPRTALRIKHPYGGGYKIALMRWFKGGCL